MSTIYDLPYELLCEVFEYFSLRNFDNDYPLELSARRERTRALRNLCLVSKTFQSSAQPLLHQFFDGLNEPRRTLFLRTIIERPDLAVHVKEIYPGDTDESQIDRKIDRGLFVTAAQSLEIKFKHSFCQSLSFNDPQAEMALLLRLTPNLELLEFGVSEGGEWRYICMLNLVEETVQNASSQSGSRARGPLSALRHMNASWVDRDKNQVVYPLFLHKIMGLPSLRKFTTLEFSADGTLMKEFAINISPVVDISFVRSSINETALRNFLGCCKQLNSFTWIWDEISDKGTIRPEVLGGLLRLHKDSLEKIVLDTHKCADPPEYYMDHHKPIGSFKDYAGLKYLEIDTVFLLGHGTAFHDEVAHAWVLPYSAELADAFPPSLETLVINSICDSEACIVPFLLDLATCCKTRLPRLKLVNFSLSGWRFWKSMAATPGSIQLVKMRFEMAGVKYKHYSLKAGYQ